MLKSGIIVGVIAFILTLIVSVFSPICSICGAILLGLLAGYLAGVFERPLTQQEALRQGAGAGALTGGLMIFASVIAAVLNASMLQDPNAQIFNQLMDLPPADPGVVWVAQILVACCIGLVNIALLAGSGAGGGALWQQMNASKREAEGPIPPPS